MNNKQFTHIVSYYLSILAIATRPITSKKFAKILTFNIFLNLIIISLNGIVNAQNVFCKTPERYQPEPLQSFFEDIQENKSQGNWEQAIKIYQEKILEYAEIHQDKKLKARTLLNIGDLYRANLKDEEAKKSINEALGIFEYLKDDNGKADSYFFLGGVYSSLRQDFETAIKNYENAKKLYQKEDNCQGQLQSEIRIGRIYLDLGKLSESDKSLNDAKKFLDKLNNSAWDEKLKADLYNELGGFYQQTNKTTDSLDSYKKALEIYKKTDQNKLNTARVNMEIGEVYRMKFAADKNDQDSKKLSREYLEKSLNYFKDNNDIRGMADTEYYLALFYDTDGNPKEAKYHYDIALKIRKEIGDYNGEISVLNGIGDACWDENNYTCSIKNWQESVQKILEVRKSLKQQNRKSFLEKNKAAVINLTKTFIQQNEPDKAFEWLNLATTADLVDYNRLINAKVADPKIQKVINDWNTNNQKLEVMRQQLQIPNNFSEKAAQEMRKFEENVNQDANDIAKKYPEVAELFEITTTDITNLRNNISPGTLVIQPVILQDKVVIFLLTKKELTFKKTDIKFDEFNQLISQYREQLADYQNSDVYVTSAKLYEILIRPIEEEIERNHPQNLAIIATDKFRYIPFETLYDEKNEKHLLEKYPISYLTHISTHGQPRPSLKVNKDWKVMAFANPKPTKQELKGTEIEAETINKIFPNSETYLGKDATIETFKNNASRFDILHIGTHGCFNQNDCLNLDMKANTILFANNQQYNIADAALLGLTNTELIILSACSTATEINSNGTEILGLAYVLERAGAKSVIASLWNVEDTTSEKIMTQFYKNFKNGMTKSEAMRQAKLLQINQHPFFWSPFILIGDAN